MAWLFIILILIIKYYLVYIRIYFLGLGAKCRDSGRAVDSSNNWIAAIRTSKDSLYVEILNDKAMAVR